MAPLSEQGIIYPILPSTPKTLFSDHFRSHLSDGFTGQMDNPLENTDSAERKTSLSVEPALPTMDPVTIEEHDQETAGQQRWDRSEILRRVAVYQTRKDQVQMTPIPGYIK